MIQGFGGYASMMGQRPQTPQMTADQKAQLTSVLDGYDAANMTEKDARTLVGQIKELGITPSRELTMVLAEKGLDARAVAAQAGLSAPNNTAKPQTASQAGYSSDPARVAGPRAIDAARDKVDDKMLDLISEVMDGLNEAEDDSATFATRLAQRLEQEGYDSTAPIMDFYA